MSRIATSFGRLGLRRASNRSSTALATLLTFCPPGPEERTKALDDLALVDEEIADFHGLYRQSRTSTNRPAIAAAAAMAGDTRWVRPL